MTNTMKEFRDFISRGNVLDLAIGVIIGGAFGKIVSSLVDDIIMPLVGKLLGGVNFSGLYVSLNGETYETLDAAKAAGAPVLAYGNFIQNVVDFLIIAFVIFLVIKKVSGLTARFKKEEAAAAPTTKVCDFCKMEVDIAATRCPHCTSELV